MYSFLSGFVRLGYSFRGPFVWQRAAVFHSSFVRTSKSLLCGYTASCLITPLSTTACPGSTRWPIWITLLWTVAGGGLVAKSRPTLQNTMDCSLPGSSVQGIPQERIRDRAAISCYKRSSQCRDRTYTSWITRQFKQFFFFFFTPKLLGKLMNHLHAIFLWMHILIFLKWIWRSGSATSQNSFMFNSVKSDCFPNQLNHGIFPSAVYVGSKSSTS